MHKLEIEEEEEKIRHNELYSKTHVDTLFIDPIHYQKFDLIKKHVHCYTYAVACLGDVKGRRILDLGCGTGWFSIILAKRGAYVHGIDISAKGIDVAERRAEINGVADRVSFSVMSIYDLSFEKEYFDEVIGLSVLHHVNEKKILCNELKRILKPGGRCVFNEPFGESEILEKIRLLVPVEIMEEDKTHWNEQVKYKDLDVFREHFHVSWREFQFFSRLDRILKSEKLIKRLGLLDRYLLKRLPMIRRYSRDIVVILDKKE